MKRILKMILTGCMLVCIAFLFACCGSEKNENNRKTISLPEAQVGEIVEISLKSYGGTIYAWNYEIEPGEGVEYIASKFVPTRDDSDWAGGGKIVYTFKILAVGNYLIKFSAKDVSQQEILPIETIIYELTVK